MGRILPLCAACTVSIVLAGSGEKPPVDRLLGHWPLRVDAQDHSGHGRHATNRGVVWTADHAAAHFQTRGAFLEVPAAQVPPRGTGDFSIALWLQADDSGAEFPGDLLSQYDPARRRGFQLAIKDNPGTFSAAGQRQLHFGMDDNKESQWVDCGRPGNALLAFALSVHGGELYAGTCEPGKGESGHVYRYGGGTAWIDCGSPDPCNSVTALTAFNGKLYAGVGKYRVAGSSLPESLNPHVGGAIYQYEGGKRWTLCGRLPNVEAVGGLVHYRGRLYAASLYHPAGFFRYEGGTNWSDCGTPNGKRVEALTVWNGSLWASGYDEGHVYRFDGERWTDCGRLGENTQTYSFAIYEGRLLVGTWPSGRVYRFEDVNRWTDVGRLGEELEVMGMLVHNGRLLAGTLPRAEVYSYEGGTLWRRLAQLDQTPDVKYRRAWTMAEFQGRVFCATLPSGKVFAYEAGKNATWDHAMPAGWHHVAGVKRSSQLELYVDGKAVATSRPFKPEEFDLTVERPLRIGAGQNDTWRGKIRDVRLYGRALTEVEVRALAQ